MAAALFFSRQWLVARIEKGVQHGFDSRLEAIRAELRASEERLKSTLRDRENEIALLRNTVLAGSASRQPLLDKRRFEAVERVWTAVNNMAGHFRLLSEFMAKDVGDPRMKRVLSMFSPPDMRSLKTLRDMRDRFYPNSRALCALKRTFASASRFMVRARTPPAAPCLRQINPTGKFSLSPSGKSLLGLTPSCPRGRGVGHRHRTLGWDAVDAAVSGVKCVRRAVSVSGQRSAGRTMLKRTVKSCGPDASVVGVKSQRRCESPTGPECQFP